MTTVGGDTLSSHAPSNRDRVFRLIAALFVLAAAFHALAGVAPGLGLGGTRGRHAGFVVVNLVIAWMVVRPSTRRKPVTLAACALFAAQQLHSHGGRALAWWQQSRRVDVVSLAVLGVLMTLLVLLVREAWPVGGRRDRAR